MYLVINLQGLFVLLAETTVSRERARPCDCVCVSSDTSYMQAQAGIFHCHPRRWEALLGDMSAPCLLVVLMKLGVGRVGSVVQVPGFPSNESASPHSNWLLPWELKLGLPSMVLKYRLISSTHTHVHACISCKGRCWIKCSRSLLVWLVPALLGSICSLRVQWPTQHNHLLRWIQIRLKR